MRNILFLLLLLGTSCKKYIDVNKDPNNPVAVQEALVLAPVELDISSVITGGYGGNGLATMHANHWMQTIALNQPVPNEGTYRQFNQDMSDSWKNIYVTCLNNLKNMDKQAVENEHFNYAGIAKILSAWCLAIATDFWGDIPYSQALQGSETLQPAYDKQEDIYKAIQKLLDDGIADIAKNDAIVPAGDDYFYEGDMGKWTRLAYTLKARYYMHLTKAPGYTAAAQADLALAALQKGMQGNDDDLFFDYPGSAGQQNPIYAGFLPVSTLVLSSATVDTLVKRNDPRLAKLVAKSKQNNDYKGRAIGTPDISGSLDIYSLPGTAYGAAGAPVYVFNYSEALFLKAEATLYKLGAAAADTFYRAGIRAHMTKLGIGKGEMDAYVAARSGGLTLQRIMEEKKIANYLSIENFNDWRRTGFPVLTKVPNALSEIPRRMLYPQSEILSNPQAVHTAKLTDRVWWDAP